MLGIRYKLHAELDAFMGLVIIVLLLQIIKCLLVIVELRLQLAERNKAGDINAILLLYCNRYYY